MRRKNNLRLLLSTLLITICVTAFLPLPNVKANEPITILIDGEIFHPPDIPPFISSNRVMVPFRPIAEALGAEGDWEPDLQRVTISLRNRQISFFMGGRVMFLTITDEFGNVGNPTLHLDVPATLVNNNRAFVPVRAVSEALGASVEWIDESRTVIISPSSPTAPLPEENEVENLTY